MQKCKRCDTDLLDETARQSYPQIEKLLKAENPYAANSQKEIKSQGPLCYRCLAARYAALARAKHFK